MQINHGLDVMAVSGARGKSITGVFAYKHGSVQVIALEWEGGGVCLKSKQGLLEIGGTVEWGTGRVLEWPEGMAANDDKQHSG